LAKADDQHPAAAAWCDLSVAALGFWLASSSWSLGYAETTMHWSDLGAGILLVFTGLASIRNRAARWASALVGLWLLLAPLVLEAAAAAYANSTLVGILVIALALVVPRPRGSSTPAPELPPGWSFNPSSWIQRTPIIVLAWFSFLISRYLTSYQLGYAPTAWDPVFDDGTHEVLTSDVSEAFPVSDAGLGAIAYALEALIGAMGNTSRWRTAPWIVALFGLLVVPLGIVSIVLIMLQPLAVGAWCFLCLVTAGGMLVMAALALPEVVAMVQFLIWTKRQQRSLWNTFWQGGAVEGGEEEMRPVRLSDPLPNLVAGMVQGVTVPWNLAATALLGGWLMYVPTAMSLTAAAADSHYLAAALVITVSVVAMAEVARGVRWLNAVIGIALASIVWMVEGAPLAAQVHAVALGLLLIALGVRRGPVHERYGTSHLGVPPDE
jgi:uncharacterized membrane protein